MAKPLSPPTTKRYHLKYVKAKQKLIKKGKTNFILFHDRELPLRYSISVYNYSVW